MEEPTRKRRSSAEIRAFKSRAEELEASGKQRKEIAQELGVSASIITRLLGKRAVRIA